MEKKENSINEELIGGVVKEKNLDPTTLIIRDDDKLKEIVSKSFADMTAEEKKKLPVAKFRVVSKKNTFTGKNERYVRIIFDKGIYFERIIDVERGEEVLLKELYPQLFETPKTKEDIAYVYVPVRMYSYYNEERNTYSYQFSAELCKSIIMRGRPVRNKVTGQRRYLNNFTESQLQVMLLRDLKYKFVLLDKRIIDEELEEDSYDDVDD